MLYFESETVCLLRFYNLEAWTHDPVSLLICATGPASLNDDVSLPRGAVDWSVAHMCRGIRPVNAVVYISLF